MYNDLHAGQIWQSRLGNVTFIIEKMNRENFEILVLLCKKPSGIWKTGIKRRFDKSSLSNFNWRRIK